MQESPSANWKKSPGPDSYTEESHPCATAPVLLRPPFSFTPDLSHDLTQAMLRIGTWMAGQAKFCALYEEPFWRESGLSGQAFSECGPLCEIHDGSSDGHGPYGLSGFVGIPAAQHATIDNSSPGDCFPTRRYLRQAGSAADGILLSGLGPRTVHLHPVRPRRAAVTVADGVGERGRVRLAGAKPVEQAVRVVNYVGAAVGDRALRDAADAGDEGNAQALGRVQIRVVGQHVDHDGRILVRRFAVGHRLRRVVDAQDGDHDARRIGLAVPVGHRVGERVRRELARGQVLELTVGVVVDRRAIDHGRAALGRVGDVDDGQHIGRRRPGRCRWPATSMVTAKILKGSSSSLTPRPCRRRPARRCCR